jgi:threonyl-tRNA synthetase
MIMREDKAKICEMFAQALKETRYCVDLEKLVYEKDEHENEYVTAYFKDGETIKSNVTWDSGVAMMRDILKNFR